MMRPAPGCMRTKPEEKAIKALIRMIGIIIAAAVILYVGVLITMYFLQPSLVYFPSRTIESTPNDIGLDYEEVTLKTDDGVEIAGWFIPAPQARATLLFCHGNGGNISHRLESIEQFHRLHLSVFIFDYHGYGKSGGHPGEKETYLDAKAAWNYLTATRGISPDSIIIFGRSLGGAVASWLASRHQSKLVIIESSFLSLPDIGAYHYPFLPVKLLARFKYNTKDRLTEIKAPILFIHSPEDDVAPYAQGKKLYELAGEPKEFLQISGRHNEGYIQSDAEYRRGIEAFLNKYLTPSSGK